MGARVEAPTLSDDDRASLRDFWDPYDAHREEITEEVRVAARAVDEFRPVMDAMSPEEQAQREERSRVLQRAAIFDGEWSDYLDDLMTQGSGYARMGISFAAWYEIIRVFRTALLSRVMARYQDDRARLVSAIHGMDRFVDIAMSSIGTAYLETKQEIIEAQQDALREVSTPVLQVRDRMLILPIIGLLDTHRARLLTETLLVAVRDRRAKVVVMDITGVPIVDSRVANHLIQTVEAAKLMGATVIVTGVSPQIAQTLVAIGANLGEVRTVGDLQGGIEEGERLLAVHVGETRQLDQAS